MHYEKYCTRAWARGKYSTRRSWVLFLSRAHARIWILWCHWCASWLSAVWRSDALDLDREASTRPEKASISLNTYLQGAQKQKNCSALKRRLPVSSRYMLDRQNPSNRKSEEPSSTVSAPFILLLCAGTFAKAVAAANVPVSLDIWLPRFFVPSYVLS